MNFHQFRMSGSRFNIAKLMYKSISCFVQHTLRNKNRFYRLLLFDIRTFPFFPNKQGFILGKMASILRQKHVIMLLRSESLFFSFHLGIKEVTLRNGVNCRIQYHGHTHLRVIDFVSSHVILDYISEKRLRHWIQCENKSKKQTFIYK